MLNNSDNNDSNFGAAETARHVWAFKRLLLNVLDVG